MKSCWNPLSRFSNDLTRHCSKPEFSQKELGVERTRCITDVWNVTISGVFVKQKLYLYEVWPDLVHGTHLNISQVFDQHDDFFHTAPSLQYLSFQIVEIQFKFFSVRPVQRYCQEIVVCVFEAAKSAAKALNMIWGVRKVVKFSSRHPHCRH